MRKKNDYLIKNIVFIDGIGRSGKTALSNVVASLKNFESIEFNYNLENFLAGVKLGYIKISFAKQFLIKMLDEVAYDKFLARRSNFRKGETTSVSNYAFPEIYKSRLKKKEGDKVIKEIINSNKKFPFSTHDLMSMIKILYDLNLNFKIIEIYRNPIENVISWYNKGLGKRFGKDKRLFRLEFTSGKNLNYPWFIKNDEKKWQKLNEIEKCAFYVIKMTKSSIREHRANKFKKNILAISLEKWLTNTNFELKRICKFLKSNKTKKTIKIMKSLSLPRKLNNNEISKNKSFLKEKISEKLYKELLILENRYNKKTYNLL